MPLRHLPLLTLITTLAVPQAAEAAGEQAAPDEATAPEEPAAPEEEADAEEGPPQLTPEKAFRRGLKSFYDQDYQQAAWAFWAFIKQTPPEDENAPWAEYFLAASLKELGLYHGAAEHFYSVAKERAQPELLPETFAALEEIVNHRPHDRVLLIDDLIYGTEFGYLPERVSDFVHYIKGVTDYRRGHVRWAQNHFSRINPESPYRLKARHVTGVWQVKKQKIERAEEIFQEILDSPVEDGADLRAVAAVKDQARRALARLRYEQKRYPEAYDLYQALGRREGGGQAEGEPRGVGLSDAAIFLEKAWTLYYQKDAGRAMGILYALRAPAFADHFAPEQYVLKALLYRNLCHYIAAKRAVREFRYRYGEALDHIRRRLPLNMQPELRTAALQRPHPAHLASFLRSLEEERQRLAAREDEWAKVGLYQHLHRVYRLKELEVKRELDLSLEDALGEVAEVMLDYQEQMNLLDYEIGMDIFKRIRRGQARETAPEEVSIPLSSEKVYYPFDGEFWNDELHDYRFFIEDKCFVEHEWD